MAQERQEHGGDPSGANNDPVQEPGMKLMLLGKTGTGKSSTGNSILLGEEFGVSHSSNSCTTDVKKIAAMSENSGDMLTIIDTPGLKDTRSMGCGDAIKKVISNVDEAMGKFQSGVDCFLFVMKYGDKFTDDDQWTVDFLTKIFGDNFYDFCILVFTHGDNFERDNGVSTKPDGTRITFKDWCNQQVGNLKILIDKCNNRVILFDNYSTTIENKREKQRTRLITIIESMNPKGYRYSIDMYEKKSDERNRLIEEANLPKIRTLFLEKTYRYNQDLNNIQHSKEKSHQTKIEELNQLKEQTKTLLIEIEDVKYSDGELDGVRNIVRDIVDIVGSEVQNETMYHQLQDRQYTIAGRVIDTIGNLAASPTTPILGFAAMTAVMCLTAEHTK